MKILELCMSVLAPDNCLGCDVTGSWLCAECQPAFLYPEMCHVCKKPSTGSLTCKKCMRSTKLAALYVYTALDGLPKDLVWTAKYLPSRSAAVTMGSCVATALPYLDPGETIVVHTPTAPSRIRQRAFDQALVMARYLAKEKVLPRKSALRRLSNHHQVGSTRKERLEHMQGAFSCPRADLVKGKTVLVVDDVYTTGATLESVAHTLRAAGAKRVIGVVFARAE